MSIFSQLFHGQITFATAAAEVEAWGEKTVKSLAADPGVVAVTGEVVRELKQAASDAVSIADSLAGPIIASAAVTVEGVADTAFKAYFGPFSPTASKATHDSVDRIAAGLKALIDAKTAEFKAAMGTAPPTS